MILDRINEPKDVKILSTEDRMYKEQGKCNRGAYGS